MKKFLAAGIAAIAMAATAAPAYALVETDLGTVALSDSFPADPTFFFSLFNFQQEGMTGGNYLIHYSFSFPTTGVSAGNASTSLVGGDNTLFNSVDLNGAAFVLDPDLSAAKLKFGPALAGTNLLNVHFKLNNNGLGAFNGSVSATAVPESATWAMMMAGFAALGWSMRRRSHTTARVKMSMA